MNSASPNVQANQKNTKFIMIGCSSTVGVEGGKEYIVDPIESYKSPLTGVISDIQRFKNKGQKLGWDHNYLSSCATDPRDKEHIMKLIGQNFASPKQYVILFYTGHGTEKQGNWIIKVLSEHKFQTISLEQIYELWQKKKSNSSKKLVIVMDSCYSGKWVVAHSFYAKPDISIFAASEHNNRAKDVNGGLLLRILFGQKQNFKNNFDKLMENDDNVGVQRPVFVTNKSKPAELGSQHLKFIQNNIFSVFTMNSSDPSCKPYLNDMEAPGKYEGPRDQFGRRSGIGKMKYINNDVYEGEFLHDMLHGQGTFTSVNGQAVYKGKFHQNKLHGAGKLISNGIQFPMIYHNGIRKE